MNPCLCARGLIYYKYPKEIKTYIRSNWGIKLGYNLAFAPTILEVTSSGQDLQDSMHWWPSLMYRLSSLIYGIPNANFPMLVDSLPTPSSHKKRDLSSAAALYFPQFAFMHEFHTLDFFEEKTKVNQTGKRLSTSFNSILFVKHINNLKICKPSVKKCSFAPIVMLRIWPLPTKNGAHQPYCGRCRKIKFWKSLVFVSIKVSNWNGL